jgi:AraC-like DNA-binding protein
MRTAEMISAVIYLLMQVYYCTLEIWEVRRMKRALAGFYDYDTSQLTGWFGVSVVLLGLSGLMAPIAIFWSDGWLLIYSLTLFFTIFYCVINFYSYGIDHAGQQTISEAEENAKEAGLDDEKSGNVMDVTEKLHIEQMVNRWILNGGYTKSGITMQNVVDEIGIPRYQLTAWLKTTEWELFNPWLTDLRVKEAKRQIRLHPDWSNDTIAERCGFSSRSYFQTVFRKNTGMTPAQFIQLCQGLNNK